MRTVKKQWIICCISSILCLPAICQPLFTCGNTSVDKEEFIRAFSKNASPAADKAASLKEYLQLYTGFKMKVNDAKALKLDTLSQLRNDMLNFRSRLEADYLPGIEVMMEKTGFKKNKSVNEGLLLLFADSIAYAKEKRPYPIAKEIIFTVGNSNVKAAEWFSFAVDYKLNKALYKGESNAELYEKFIRQTVSTYYRNHLEEYNPDFRYEVQEFKEGSLMYEITNRKVWNRAVTDANTLRAFYEANKEKFAWGESAEVILINSKSYAYADYAFENMKKGMDWKKICNNSEGMTQGDSSRYEIAQLPVKPGTKLTEGELVEIMRNSFDEGASFIKVIKLYPAKMPRSFEEARSMVINEYQKQLEESWLKELAVKYPVKINSSVFQSLLK